MQFHYTAKTRLGERSAGVLEADSIADARRQLRDQGLFLLSVAPERESDGDYPQESRRGFFRPKATRADLMATTSQLAIMSQTGIDLAEALQNLAEQCPRPVLKAALREVYLHVSDGESVSAAMKRQSHVFDETYVASIAAGELSGRLPEVLHRLSRLLRNEIRLRSAMRTALAYPAVLAFVSLLVVFALMFFVLPQFAVVFENLDVPAPPLTQLLLDFSDSLRSYWLVWAVLLAAGTFGLFRLRRTRAARRFVDGILLNNVLTRNVLPALYTGRSFRLLGTMLQSGVPLLEAIRMGRTTIRNCYYRSLFDRLEQEVTNGKGVGKTLLASRIVPVGAAQMVATAEQTGRLGTVLESVGEFYEDEGERKLIELTKYVEPAIIIVMGAIVATIVLSVILPIFDFSGIR